MTRLPLCVLARADTFTLAGAGGVAEGGVVVGGRLLDHDNYCISGTRAWYCRQAWNRWVAQKLVEFFLNQFQNRGK